MSNKTIIKRITSMDSKLQSLQYDLQSLGEDISHGCVSGRKAADLLDSYYGKIEAVRLMLENLQISLDKTTTV